MPNLSSILVERARTHADKIALVSGQDRLSYRDLNDRVNRTAAGLQAHGVRRGDVVALMCPNVSAFPVAYYAIVRLGAAVVPINPLLKAREIEYILNDSRAAGYLCYEGTDKLRTGFEGWTAFQNVKSCKFFCVIESGVSDNSTFDGVYTFSDLHASTSLREIVDCSPDDTCAILYTSGTTGKPKGAQLSHANLMLNAEATLEFFERPENEIHLVFLPLFHAFAQGYHLNPAVLAGATVVLLPRFEPSEVLHALKREGVTMFGGVPTMFWNLLHSPVTQSFDRDRDAPSLKYVFTAGQSMPQELSKKVEEAFGVPVVELYGMTEVTIATCNPLLSARRGSIGIPVRNADVRVVDTHLNEIPAGQRGEIVMRGLYLTKGYLGRETDNLDAFRDGWFHSGDVAYRDEDGYLYIVDRIKDVIIRGGENIYPREIEEVLLTHPAVSQAAVIGIPDERFGEEVKAFVVSRPGQPMNADDLVKWSRLQMAKYPRIVEVVSSLPTGPTGKILKHELRQLPANDARSTRDTTFPDADGPCLPDHSYLLEKDSKT